MRAQTSAQLKQNARGILLGKYKNAIAVLLATELIIITITLLTGTGSNPGTVAGLLLQFAVTLIISLFNGILIVGINAFYLNIACGQPYQLSDIFTGFRSCPDKAIGVQFCIRLFSTLPLAPAIFLLFMLLTPYGADIQFPLRFTFFASLLLGTAISVWVSCTYSQCFYLLLDFPECSIREILALSRRVMKGHRLRLLYLYLSFIPMLFAGIVSLGIGLLFVVPYQNMTYTLFYLDLLQYKQAMNNTLQSSPEPQPIQRVDYRI
ncbi:MAG: DUF975 family protein [Lachnospiraceae bacterium]|nr:DUF975 family protein [Lachnospiraceae bacterium]